MPAEERTTQFCVTVSTMKGHFPIWYVVTDNFIASSIALEALSKKPMGERPYANSHPFCDYCSSIQAVTKFPGMDLPPSFLGVNVVNSQRVGSSATVATSVFVTLIDKVANYWGMSEFPLPFLPFE